MSTTYNMKRKPLVFTLLTVFAVLLMIAGFLTSATPHHPVAHYAPHGGSGAFFILLIAVLVARRRRKEAEAAAKNAAKENNV